MPTVQKPPPADIATQAVLEKIAEDTAQMCGVGTISTLLSNEGMLLPR
jgi:predicted class III extradiol MEMO1 family dioxygenase